MKEKWVILIILCIIIIGCIVYILYKNKKNKPFKRFESFENKGLIDNGSFSNGNHPKQYAGHHGNFDIIIFPNCGKSSYVLRESHNNKLGENEIIFYRIDLNLKPATSYCFACLYYSTVDDDLIHSVKYNAHDSSHTLKTIIRDDGDKSCNFKYRYTIFKTPNSNGTIETEFQIAQNFNNMKGQSYITNLELFELTESDNIPVSSDLRSYFNCYSSDSITNGKPIIKDLSNNGFDFNASVSENVNIGNLKMGKNILTGPNSFKLQNNQISLSINFTAFLFIKKNDVKPVIENMKGEQSEESDEYPNIPNIYPVGDEILRIPGNQGTAFSIIIPENYGKIYVSAGGLIFETSILYPINVTENMFAVQYDGTKIVLFLNQEIILSEICPKIYFDNKKLQINPNGTYSGNTIAFAFYNSKLSNSQIIDVSKYFIKMNAIGKDLVSVSSKVKDDIESFIRKPLVKKDIHNNDQTCPQVMLENNHYYIIVPPDSELSKQVGYDGVRDYGTNIDTAKNIFEINFPKCSIPDILDKRKFKGDLENCPFILTNDDNPCKKYECSSIDWNSGKIENKHCKKNIDSYCSKYSNLDGACYCWKPENKNNKECLKWLKQFDDGEKCDFRKFSIEKHPDSNKWIEKDKIPCWGCNLDK